MARPDRSPEIDAALLQAVRAHPRDLVGVVGAQLGLSRSRVAARARALVQAGYLRRTGTTRPVYAPGEKRRFTRRYPRQGLAEDRVWFADLAPLLDALPRNVLDIAQHGLTEMVNNAIDHSYAEHVDVHMDFDGARLQLTVADDGVGIFERITRALGLPDPRLALLELAKGKLTTDPRRHSGEGIFFTSRAFDDFVIVSGGLVFDHDHASGHDVLDERDALTSSGTTVFMGIAADSPRRLKDVFDAYSSGPDDYAFARTIVPVRLAKVGEEQLLSRSQARRLLQRVERFRVVMLDFADVASIGQAFADEIFRVFADAHPEVELVPMGANADVQAMIRRAETLRAETFGKA